MPKNGAANCALEICCLRTDPNHHTALAGLIAEGTGMEAGYCDAVATWLDATFDLMPLGTTKAMKDAIVAVWENRHPHGS